LSFRRSNSQKQSINDAFQYVAVPPIPPEGVGMNDAKIQKSYQIWLVLLEKLKNMPPKLDDKRKNSLSSTSLLALF
jgi:hypothetical protein